MFHFPIQPKEMEIYNYALRVQTYVRQHKENKKKKLWRHEKFSRAENNFQ